MSPTRTTVWYLDRVKNVLALSSDYGAAKALTVTKQSISRYRNYGGTFDDAVALRVASILRMPFEKLIADREWERATKPELKDAWRRIAQRAAALAIIAFTPFAGFDNNVFAA